MMKVEKRKGVANQPHKHLHARISYLYQAATYLATVQTSHHEDQKTTTALTNPEVVETNTDNLLKMNERAGENNLEKEISAQVQMKGDAPSLNVTKPLLIDASGSLGSARLLSHLRSVSLKSQIRLSSEMKHSICKRCNTLLISGHTSTNQVENKSRGGKKAWADLLVITCNVCGMAKRFPVKAKRQQRRIERTKKCPEILQQGDTSVEKAGG